MSQTGGVWLAIMQPVGSKLQLVCTTKNLPPKKFQSTVASEQNTRMATFSLEHSLKLDFRLI